MTVRELAAVPDVGPLLVKGLVGSARKRGLPVEKLPRLSLLLDDQAQDVRGSRTTAASSATA